MKKTRIDFEDNGGWFAQIVHLAAEYQRAIRDGDLAKAAGWMDRIALTAERLTDETLLAADSEMSRRDIAEGMGWISPEHPQRHKTIAYRINRARRNRGEDVDASDERG